MTAQYVGFAWFDADDSQPSERKGFESQREPGAPPEPKTDLAELQKALKEFTGLGSGNGLSLQKMDLAAEPRHADRPQYAASLRAVPPIPGSDTRGEQQVPRLDQAALREQPAARDVREQPAPEQSTKPAFDYAKINHFDKTLNDPSDPVRQWIDTNCPWLKGKFEGPCTQTTQWRQDSICHERRTDNGIGWTAIIYDSGKSIQRFTEQGPSGRRELVAFRNDGVRTTISGQFPVARGDSNLV